MSEVNVVVPMARLIFKDGHTEDPLAMYMLTFEDFIITTISGDYRPYNGNVLKYHPQSDTPENEVHYDLDECWVIDETVEELRIWYEEE